MSLIDALEERDKAEAADDDPPSTRNSGSDTGGRPDDAASATKRETDRALTASAEAVVGKKLSRKVPPACCICIFFLGGGRLAHCQAYELYGQQQTSVCACLTHCCPMPQVGASHFDLLQVIGQGGYGKVNSSRAFRCPLCSARL